MTAMTDDRERTEMRRMLAWFKQQLPPHTVDAWHLEVTEIGESVTVETDDRPNVTRVGSMRHWRLKGYGRCTRCNRAFEVPNIGNAATYSEDGIPGLVETMKAWVLRDAERANPCWGDVPPPPNDDHMMPVAVMDTADG